MKIYFSQSFQKDLDEIENYLQDKTETGFVNIKINLYSTLGKIKLFPYIGVKTEKEKYYTFPIRKYDYKIIYKVLEKEIRIMRLIHNKRKI
jgi:plasmid stabilization system protein ParE